MRCLPVFCSALFYPFRPFRWIVFVVNAFCSVGFCRLSETNQACKTPQVTILCVHEWSTRMLRVPQAVNIAAHTCTCERVGAAVIAATTTMIGTERERAVQEIQNVGPRWNGVDSVMHLYRHRISAFGYLTRVTSFSVASVSLASRAIHSSRLLIQKCCVAAENKSTTTTATLSLALHTMHQHTHHLHRMQFFKYRQNAQRTGKQCDYYKIRRMHLLLILFFIKFVCHSKITYLRSVCVCFWFSSFALAKRVYLPRASYLPFSLCVYRECD